MTKQFIPHHRTEAQAWELSKQWWETIYDGPGDTIYLVAPQAHPDEKGDIDAPGNPLAERAFMPIDEEIAANLSMEWPPKDAEWLQNLPMAGDVQTFDGVDYRSLIDNNMWSPTAYPAGWELVDAPTGPQPWVQPTGAQDAYIIGDEVTHPNAQDGGTVWLFESKIDANTTEPGTDGTFHRYWEPIERVTP